MKGGVVMSSKELKRILQEQEINKKKKNLSVAEFAQLLKR